MKDRHSELKLAAVLLLLALANFGLEGYPIVQDPICEGCEDPDDSFIHYLSISFDPGWISLFPGESANVQASTWNGEASWRATVLLPATGCVHSAAAGPGPAAQSMVTVVAKSDFFAGQKFWGGLPRWDTGDVIVSCQAPGPAGGGPTTLYGREVLKVLGLVDQVDTVTSVGADAGGSGWLDLQVTKRRYSSSPGDWTFSASLLDPADSQYVTSLATVATGPGTARVTYAAAANITPPPTCDPARLYCSITVPVQITAVGSGGFTVTEVESVSVLIRMPS